MDWKFFLTLAGGSLAGTLIKIAWDAYQGRKTKLFRRIEIEPIFKSRESKPFATVSLLEDGKNYDFDNLTVVNLTIANHSNLDIQRFVFGVTLSDGHRLVFVDCQTPDRHHVFSILTNVPQPKKPLDRVDTEVAPLNRNDEYVVKLYVHSKNSLPLTLSDIQISTSASIRWVVRESRVVETIRLAKRLLISAILISMISVVLMLFGLGYIVWTLDGLRNALEFQDAYIIELEKKLELKSEVSK